MLQDIKNHKPVKLLKYLLHFWYCAKKSIINIFNHVNTDWIITSLLNIAIEKKKYQSLETRMWRQTGSWVTYPKPLRKKHWPRFSHTFSLRFLKQNYQKYIISDVLSKILEKKSQIYRMFCLNLWSSWNWAPCGESWKSLSRIFLIFNRTDFGGFLLWR